MKPPGIAGKAEPCGPNNCRPMTVPGLPPGPPPTKIDPVFLYYYFLKIIVNNNLKLMDLCIFYFIHS